MARDYSKRKKHSSRVANVIAAHYYELKSKLCSSIHGNYCGRSTEDIFCDAIIYVIQDEAASSIKTDAEILQYFEYRHNMISFQIIRDSYTESAEFREDFTPSREEIT